MKALRLGICMAFAVICMIACFTTPANAEEQAQDITAQTAITGTGYSSFQFLSDGDVDHYLTSAQKAQITLENPQGIAGVYVLFDLEYGAYTVKDNATGKSFTAGEHGMLHEYLDLQTQFGNEPKSVTMCFETGAVRLSEITVFSQGEVPDSVQRWNKPLEGGADLVLFSTHGDDEHLYFAGLLPYYAGEKQYRVQVVYMTDHRNDTNKRTHEMLNGLWNTGVRAYPVFGSFADFRVDSLSGTYDRYQSQYNTSQEQLLGFVVEQLRRFRPMVAVGHDLAGEYGHGMHQVYADLLTKAVPLINDSASYPETAEKYGVWELPKLYLHLYEENPIVLDYDQPLAAFDGLTAFQVSQKLGFPSHKSQQWPMFVNWIYGYSRQIEKATQIETYNPAHFGLYHTTVGQDTQKNDFFENVLTYAQQEQLEQERLEQERLEQERLEQERLEQERLEQERLEQERLEKERAEQDRIEKEQQALLAQEEKQRKRILFGCLLLAGCLVAVFISKLLIKYKIRK